jgi:hypothetical protein
MSLFQTCSARHVQSILIIVLTISVPLHSGQNAALADASERNKEQSKSHATVPTGNRSSSAPRCQTTGEEEIKITCNYTATPRSESGSKSHSRVALNRAVFSFQPNDASNMLAELTFTSMDSTPISDARTIYLAIDDDARNNYVRRALPSVDFRKLSPRKPVTFSEQLRVAAFPPGRYTIELWIPDPQASLKFIPAHNFLLTSMGVADPPTGLNILAKFTVARRRK